MSIVRFFPVFFFSFSTRPLPSYEGTWPIWRTARCTLWVLNDMRQFLTPRDQNASTQHSAGTHRLRVCEREREKNRNRHRYEDGQGEAVEEGREKKLAHSCKHYAMKFIWIGVGSKFKYFSDNNKKNNEVN